MKSFHEPVESITNRLLFAVNHRVLIDATFSAWSSVLENEQGSIARQPRSRPLFSEAGSHGDPRLEALLQAHLALFRQRGGLQGR